MSDTYTVSIVKFIGGFDDITKLNLELENNISSEFMEPLIESANDQGISPLRFFSASDLDPAKMGMISQDEGTIDDSHYEVSNYYNLFDDSDCDIISSHIVPDGKLVISFHFQDEQTFYVFEHNKWNSIDVEDLF